MKSTTKQAIKEAVKAAREAKCNGKDNEAYFLLYEILYYWFDFLDERNKEIKTTMEEQTKRELIIEAMKRAKGEL